MPRNVQYFQNQGKIKVEGAQLQNLETYEIEKQASRQLNMSSPRKEAPVPESAHRDQMRGSTPEVTPMPIENISLLKNKQIRNLTM